ncbi:unnamed protein product, partial [marine sediment metagenome]
DGFEAVGDDNRNPWVTLDKRNNIHITWWRSRPAAPRRTFWKGKVNGIWSAIEDIFPGTVHFPKMIDRLFPRAENGEYLGKALSGCALTALEGGGPAATIDIWYAERDVEWGPLDGELYKYVGPPYDLLCEQKKNPTDVTDPNPEFSAIHHYD